MAFKIRDLMVNIAAAAEPENLGVCAGLYSLFLCGHHSPVAACTGHHSPILTCTGHRSPIMGCTGKRSPAFGTCTTKKSPMMGYTPGIDPGEALEELTAIKTQLQAALADVDEEIKELEDTLQPKTVEDVETLQTKLKEALEELDKIKSGLDKK
jgi:hypothetical protein